MPNPRLPSTYKDKGNPGEKLYNVGMPELLKSLKDPKLITKLKSGDVGVIPTDTIYGLVCLASNHESVERLYKLKNRDNVPGTVVAASTDQFVELGIKRAYLKAVEQFWPGGISVIVPFSAAQGNYLRRGKPDIAVRIPADLKIQSLLEKTGALLTSSANKSGQPSSNTIAEAKKYFGAKVDFYVDGGDLTSREPSTIIRMIDDAIEVIREGAVKIDEETGRIES
jgi:L-threonylcarbamoyladenylate synthase